MKKRFPWIFLGILIGAAATLAVPAYAAVKQYVLVEFTQPVLVNGKVYQDEELPILAYNGRTYVPLAKVGELLGAQVHYNDQLKRVEIGAAAPTYDEVTVVEKDISSGKTGSPAATDGPAGRKGDILQPDTEIVEEEEPGYKGYPDSADPSYQMALEYGYELPPLMSEGWISQGMLDEIEYITLITNKERKELYFARYTPNGIDYLLDASITDEFLNASSGDFTFESIKFKKYRGDIYVSIDDLQRKGIIK